MKEEFGWLSTELSGGVNEKLPQITEDKVIKIYEIHQKCEKTFNRYFKFLGENNEVRNRTNHWPQELRAELIKPLILVLEGIVREMREYISELGQMLGELGLNTGELMNALEQQNPDFETSNEVIKNKQNPSVYAFKTIMSYIELFSSNVISYLEENGFVEHLEFFTNINIMYPSKKESNSNVEKGDNNEQAEALLDNNQEEGSALTDSNDNDSEFKWLVWSSSSQKDKAKKLPQISKDSVRKLFKIFINLNKAFKDYNLIANLVNGEFENNAKVIENFLVKVKNYISEFVSVLNNINLNIGQFQEALEQQNPDSDMLNNLIGSSFFQDTPPLSNLYGQILENNPGLYILRASIEIIDYLALHIVLDVKNQDLQYFKELKDSFVRADKAAVPKKEDDCYDDDYSDDDYDEDNHNKVVAKKRKHEEENSDLDKKYDDDDNQGDGPGLGGASKGGAKALRTEASLLNVQSSSKEIVSDGKSEGGTKAALLQLQKENSSFSIFSSEDVVVSLDKSPFPRFSLLQEMPIKDLVLGDEYIPPVVL